MVCLWLCESESVTVSRSNLVSLCLWLCLCLCMCLSVSVPLIEISTSRTWNFKFKLLICWFFTSWFFKFQVLSYFNLTGSGTRHDHMSWIDCAVLQPLLKFSSSSSRCRFVSMIFSWPVHSELFHFQVKTCAGALACVMNRLPTVRQPGCSLKFQVQVIFFRVGLLQVWVIGRHVSWFDCVTAAATSSSCRFIPIIFSRVGSLWAWVISI